MSKAVFDRVTELLGHKSVPYDVLRHAPVFTSEEAATILGIDAATVRTHLERARRGATPASMTVDGR